MSSAKRLVLSLRGGRRDGAAGSASSSTRLVLDPLAPAPVAASSAHELDEIAVVSAEPCLLKYGSGSLGAAANGPRVFPGLAAGAAAGRGGGGGASERLAASASPLAAKSSCESVLLRTVPTIKSVSRQSLLDIVSCRLGVGRTRPASTQRFSSGDSLSAAYVNRAAAVSSTASEVDLTRGQARRRELRGRLKLPPSVALATSGPAPRGPASRARRSGPLSPAGGGDSVATRASAHYARFAGSAPNWSFVFDPAGRLCYYWSMVVSLAFLYNFWVIIYRFAFQEINGETLVVWFCLDYLADFLYLADIVFHFRTGYLEDGVLQTDATKLRQHYMNSTTFYIDCLCLLPLDFLYLSIGYNSMLRSFRLVKIYRFWAFMDRTERHTNYPNLFRSTSLIHYLLVIFHWNGCLYHIIHKNDGFGSRNWVFPEAGEAADVVRQYLQSYYWCTLALTTIGDLPRPRSKGEYLFVIAQLLFGLLLFATVLGHVANIVTSVSAARKEFQAKLDGVKTYMRMRRVPADLQLKVIKWFDYLWLTQKCSDEEKAVSCLPDKLKAEIAINVHLDTLKRVEIFQNTEAGFLCELVLRLRPVLFSPGDYICRKGEVGKEMYIVNRGRLQVVADNGKTVLATLKAGSYFGEISILNMGTAGNRRTASVRSVGYSDLFVLSKKDMWDVLKEYPAARVRLEAIAVKRLEKYKRAPLERDTFWGSGCAPYGSDALGDGGAAQSAASRRAPAPPARAPAAALGRSQSAPGLVESRGRVPLEEMWVSPLEPLPAPGGPPPYAAASRPSLYSPTASPPPRRVGASPQSAVSSHSSDEDRRARPPPRSGARQMPMARYGTLEGLGAAPGRAEAARETTPLVAPQPPPPADAAHLAAADGVALEAARLLSHDALLAEVKRLRERLAVLEAENAAMSVKLSQQQWEVETRLAEIEMHICGASSGASSATEDNERNRESII